MDAKSLHKQKFTYCAIGRKLSIDRRTAKKYSESSGIPEYNRENRQPQLEPYKSIIMSWLEMWPDMTARRIFENLKNNGYEGAYDAVKRFVRGEKDIAGLKAYIRFETLAGQQAQVDFWEFQYCDSKGKWRKGYCFEMLLGFSRHVFARFVTDCRMETFLDCHIRAFNYFGGVTAEVVYDNLKQAVVKRVVGVIEYNRTLLEFASHYGFTPRACPPYSPWCKGKVERAIGYAQASFFRGYEFTTFEAANRDLRKWAEETALQRIHGTTRQRVSERFEIERPKLGSLPAGQYDTSPKHFRKVYRDCRVSYDGNFYVVPYKYVGKRVIVRPKSGITRIFNDDLQIAEHEIPDCKGKTVGGDEVYEALKKDAEQLRRKYAWGKRLDGRTASKAGTLVETLALNPGAAAARVEKRHLSEYQAFVERVVVSV